MNARHIIKALLIICLALSLLPAVVSAAPASSSCIATHVVQAGENLFRISLKYNVSMAAIMQANGLLNPNYVYVGQVLCIPGGKPVPPAPPSPPPAGTRYCVQAGDTLGTIAARFGTTVYAIMQANGLSNPNYIYVGQWLIIPATCCPSPPTPPTSGKWKGEYYDNPHLAGSAALVRYDTAVNFDWGAKSPAAKIPVDNFSVRWTRTVYLNAGAYRFTVTADDGVRLWVDDQPLIDQWGQHTATTYTKDVTLGAGYHAIRMEYQELTGVAMAMLSWVRIADGGGGGQPSGAWLGQYYDTIDLAGTPIQRFDPAIDFDWGDGSPMPGLIGDNLFSIRWTRNVLFDGGTYRFYALVDDGVRLYVDNRLVIDQWRDSNSITFFKEADITSGVHQVKVEYYEFGHQARIVVWWEKLR